MRNTSLNRKLALDTLESRRLLAGSTPFTPSLDLQSIYGVSTLELQAEVTQWLDQSPNQLALHSAGIQAPEIGLAMTPSGAPAISFDGIDDRLLRDLNDSGGIEGLPVNDWDRTMFVVAQFHDADGLAGATYGRGTLNQSFGISIGGPVQDYGRLFVEGWGGNYDYPSDIAAFSSGIGSSGWLLLSLVHQRDGTDPALNNWLYIDGVESSNWSQNYNTKLNSTLELQGNTAARLVLGEAIKGDSHVQMDVAAWLIYDQAMSSQERSVVEAYLKETYFQLDAQARALPDGVVVWLESSEGVERNGQEVIRWEDLSTSGNNLIAAGSPHFVLGATPSGQAAILLDGQGDKLERTQAAGLLDLPANAEDRSIFAVINYVNPLGVDAGVVYGKGSYNRAFGLTADGPTGALAIEGWAEPNDFNSDSTGVGAGWLVQSAVLRQNVLSHYLDGELIASTNHTFQTRLDAPASKLVIGEEISGEGFSQLQIAAVLVYDRALSVHERQQVETYLQAKYLIAQARIDAQDDSVTLSAGDTVVVDVLANDSAVGTELDPSSVQIVVPPTHASSFAINPTTGAILYVHDRVSLPDTLVYQVSDSSGACSATAVVTFQASTSEATTSNVYFVGNSLTGGLRLTEAFRPLVNGQGYELSESYSNQNGFTQIVAGASLSWHWYQKKINSDPPEYYLDEFTPELENHQWDTLVLQPFNQALYNFNTTPYPDDPKFDTWYPRPREEGVVQMANNFIRIAVHNENLRVVIYQSWPPIPALDGTNNPDFESFDFREEWLNETTSDIRSRANQAELIETLREEWSEVLVPEIVTAPMGEVLFELNERLRAQPLVDVDGTVYDDVEDFYGDRIHLRTGIGRYLMALTMYSVLYSADPRGLPIGKYNTVDIYNLGFQASFRPISSPMQTYLQDLVWDVVSNHPHTGLSANSPSQDFESNLLLAPLKPPLTSSIKSADEIALCISMENSITEQDQIPLDEELLPGSPTEPPACTEIFVESESDYSAESDEAFSEWKLNLSSELDFVELSIT